MTFTVLPLEKLLEGISPEVAENIKNAKVEPGMTKKEVELAYGPVPPIFTPDKRNITWMYPMQRNRYVRLIFRSDKLRTILDLYNDGK